MNGVLNIYKEKGFTSHDVVNCVRKILKIKKVGHTGTLDPDAEGVLPICVGKATKLSDYIMGGKKGYRAVVVLGAGTDTKDSSGVVTETKSFSFDENEIKRCVKSFEGKISQIPPMYSAVKVGGKKLYQLARQGIEIERQPREVYIHQVQVTKFMPPDKFEIDVACSKGVYIRVLCEDIGKALHTCAHMDMLVRTSTGFFHIKDSIPLSQLALYYERGEMDRVFIAMDEAVEIKNKLYIKENFQKNLINGNRLYKASFAYTIGTVEVKQKVLVYSSAGEFIGIYEIADDGGVYARALTRVV